MWVELVPRTGAEGMRVSVAVHPAKLLLMGGYFKINNIPAVEQDKRDLVVDTGTVKCGCGCGCGSVKRRGYESVSRVLCKCLWCRQPRTVQVT